MDSIENQIADKEEFIKKLESQIEDIEKKVQD
jgi:bacterioferritin (cytochrome b1)